MSRAIESIVADLPSVEHHLLYAGDECAAGRAEFASITRMPIGHYARTRAVASSVGAIQPDVLHLHSSWAGVYGRALRHRVTVLYQPHCFAFEDISRSVLGRQFYRAAERILARRTDGIIAVSRREVAMAERLAPRTEVKLLPNRSLLRDIDEKQKAPAAGPTRVVMNGRLAAQKDPEWFATVASMVDETFEFVWIGDGEHGLRCSLEEAGVRVTGWLPQDELTAELDRASVYLHTAQYEGFPLAVLDAAARRLPILLRSSGAFMASGLETVATPREAARALRPSSGDNWAALRNLEVVRRDYGADVRTSALKNLYSRHAP